MSTGSLKLSTYSLNCLKLNNAKASWVFRSLSMYYTTLVLLSAENFSNIKHFGIAWYDVLIAIARTEKN